MVAGCFAIGMIAGWPDTRFNKYAYDWLLTGEAAANWTPQSVIVAIDELTLAKGGGVPAMRTIVGEAMRKIAAAHPAAVASDVTLSDRTDPAIDQKLAEALAQVPHLILPCDLITAGGQAKWEDPLPEFRKSAVALGHVFRGESGTDGVDRSLPIEEIVDHQSRWALALETYAAAHGDNPIPIESPDDVKVGNVIIPAPRGEHEIQRNMFIRYLPAGVIPTISVLELDQHPDLIRGKAVFLGVTALSAARDRVFTPYGQQVAGVEIHAQAYETIARQDFLTPARDTAVLGICVLFAIAAGLIFGLRSGWQAYVLAAALLALSHWTRCNFSVMATCFLISRRWRWRGCAPADRPDSGISSCSGS